MQFNLRDNFLKPKGLLVVDGDWLAFKVAAILENKSV